MAQERTQGQGLTRLYLIAWIVLIALTALEASLVLLFHLPNGVRVVALIIVALMKASLIGAYYMNLRFERLAMAYMAAIPLILLALMLVTVAPDAAGLLRRP